MQFATPTTIRVVFIPNFTTAITGEYHTAALQLTFRYKNAQHLLLGGWALIRKTRSQGQSGNVPILTNQHAISLFSLLAVINVK